MTKKVYVANLNSDGFGASDVLAGLDWVDWGDLIGEQTRVFIKPNLTWPVPTPGVTVTPQAIEAIVAAIQTRTKHVIVGESDGGYHSFKAEEAFRGHNLYEIRDKYSVNLVNLSRLDSEEMSTTIAGRRVKVELPSLLLHEIDVLVTVPVPKVHVMTGVSLAFKNQWGCIPNTMRLRNHPEFALKVVAINKLLPVRLAIFDGTYFLNRMGPMYGDAISMNMLIVTNDIGAGSFACCRIMQIDPARIRHFRVACREGMFPASDKDFVLNTPLERFRTVPFYVERPLITRITYLAYNSRLGTRFLYDSPFADPLHRILYAVRRNPIIGRLLYGSVGPPSS